jgi:hypothetical protein
MAHANLPYSAEEVLLENLLRTEDGANITMTTLRHLPGGTQQLSQIQRFNLRLLV